MKNLILAFFCVLILGVCNSDASTKQQLVADPGDRYWTQVRKDSIAYLKSRVRQCDVPTIKPNAVYAQAKVMPLMAPRPVPKVTVETPIIMPNNNLQQDLSEVQQQLSTLQTAVQQRTQELKQLEAQLN